jgi:membrane-associated phospholipid phosphatase
MHLCAFALKGCAQQIPEFKLGLRVYFPINLLSSAYYRNFVPSRFSRLVTLGVSLLLATSVALAAPSGTERASHSFLQAASRLSTPKSPLSFFDDAIASADLDTGQSAQSTPPQQKPPVSTSGSSPDSRKDPPPDVTFKRVITSLPRDQYTIWTAPFHIRRQHLPWVATFVATTGVLIATDKHSMMRARSNAAAISDSNNVSDYGLAAMIAIPGMLYLQSQFTGSERARETGLLSGEALINSYAVFEILKAITGRERPTPTDGAGHFFQPQTNSGFPSGHSMLAWSVASVVAHEYPGPLTQAVVYGLASTISIARVSGRQHFPADVVAGAGIGWLIGRQMYRAHSTFRDEDAQYGTFVAPENVPREHRASTYVPLDSWVYPALKRLAGLGYIPTQILGQQPWTRSECLRQLDDADYLTQDLAQQSEVRRLIAALREELGREGRYSRSLQIESAYTRYLRISGTPLRDSYHFGQTIWNDFGRPFDEGNNLVAGASMTAVDGRFFFYARGEYQHAPGRPAESLAVQTLIGSLDGTPVHLPAPVPATNRFYPLDLYAGAQLGGYAITFGKQSLWLGPGESAPLTMSDNADPMYMLRLAHTSPFYLPGILRNLGPIQDEYLFGKLSGHHFPARPFFNLQKITFHPTKNLEIGFTRASLWAGEGRPFTARSLARNLFSLNDSSTATAVEIADPGDRKSGVDFSYHLPGLRKWLTIYADAYSDDDPSPLASPRRAAISPGIYLSHAPGIPRLDLRLENVSTETLSAFDRGGQFLYWNGKYQDANTNKGFLFGNPTGRDGRSYQGWSTYHFSPGTTLQLSYRQLKVGNAFLPGGGTQSDGMVRFDWRAHREWTVSSNVQYERWLIPSLRLAPERTVSASVQLTFHPQWQLK